MAQNTREKPFLHFSAFFLDLSDREFAYFRLSAILLPFVRRRSESIFQFQVVRPSNILILFARSKIGEVSVQLKKSVGLTGKPIWKRNQQHGNVWLRAHVTIEKPDDVATYSLAFEAVVGKGMKQRHLANRPAVF